MNDDEIKSAMDRGTAIHQEIERIMRDAVADGMPGLPLPAEPHALGSWDGLSNGTMLEHKTTTWEASTTTERCLDIQAAADRIKQMAPPLSELERLFFNTPLVPVPMVPLVNLGMEMRQAAKPFNFGYRAGIGMNMHKLITDDPAPSPSLPPVRCTPRLVGETLYLDEVGPEDSPPVAYVFEYGTCKVLIPPDVDRVTELRLQGHAPAKRYTLRHRLGLKDRELRLAHLAAGVPRTDARLNEFARRERAEVDQEYLRLGVLTRDEVAARAFNYPNAAAHDAVASAYAGTLDNRHTQKRWRLRIAHAVEVACDALDNQGIVPVGPRGAPRSATQWRARAIAALAEVIPLRDAIELTEPYPTPYTLPQLVPYSLKQGSSAASRPAC